jgi:hypothetical protein
MSRLNLVTAVANQSGAMEADTISKNGRSLKSHTSRGNISICMLVLLFVISFGVGLSACTESRAQSGSNTKVSVRWEYKILQEGYYTNDKNGNELEPLFNELGQDGWEYTGSIGSPNGPRAHHFKRRLP